MTNDYGVKKARKKPPILWLALGVLAVLLPASFVPKMIQQRNANVAEAKAWSMPGEPCPTVTKAGYDTAPLPRAKGTEYEGVLFERRLGHMECTLLHADGGKSGKTYPVCRFSSPGMVGVETSDKAAFFAPKQGKSVLVSLESGEPTCLVIARLDTF
jgi:hypothetical protein